MEASAHDHLAREHILNRCFGRFLSMTGNR
jgi:hypothetical protein